MKKLAIMLVILLLLMGVNASADTVIKGEWNIKEALEKLQNGNNLDTTIGEDNALRSAYSYLDVMPFSYKGLIEQLEYEGYSYEEARYAADNCEADWKEQAVMEGERYLDYKGFSYSGLLLQLKYEGYTSEEATYACDVLFGNRERKDSDGFPLEKGDHGEKITDIQNRLNELGYSAGTVDGIFGNGTQEAVKAFQKNANLETTGAVDYKTYDMLFDEEVNNTSMETDNSEEASSDVAANDTQNDFLNALLIALEEREIAANKLDISQLDDPKEPLRLIVESEYTYLEKFDDMTFEDEAFDKLAHRYIDACKMQIEATESNDNNITFVSLWNAGLHIRSGVILELRNRYNLDIPENVSIYCENTLGSAELRIY